MFEDIIQDLKLYQKRLLKGERILISVTEQCGCNKEKGCKICRGSGWIIQAKTLMSPRDNKEE